MRILLLAAFDLFPPIHGTSSIAHNFIKHAATRHDVGALISHLNSLGGEVDLTSDNLHVQYCPPSPFDRLRSFSFFVNPYYYRTAEMLCRQIRPAVIQCETIWPVLTGLYLRRRYNVPLVCVEHNVEVDRFAAQRRPQPILAVVGAVERFACRHADSVISFSETDRERLIERYGVQDDRIRIIRPGPDLADFRFDEQSRAAVRERYGLSHDQSMLTFVGNLKYLPNQQAVRRIAGYVYPAVMEEHPDARFVIIGHWAGLLADCRRERITFTGYLSREDLVAHLCATDVFLVPVESGSGIRVKIPEATACARAVVATRKAATGLEMFTDDEIVRVEGVGLGFVSAVLRLIRDPGLRKDMGARARARTMREFGWERTLDAYEEVYAKIGALNG